MSQEHKNVINAIRSWDHVTGPFFISINEPPKTSLIVVHKLLLDSEFYASSCQFKQGIRRFSISGAHAHWVGSTNTPSHATKELKMR